MNKFWMRRIVSILILCFNVYFIYAQEHSMRLNEGWAYHKGDLGGIWEVVRESEPGRPTFVPLWEAVTLPHCFNAEDAVDPDMNYYQGPGWYRTALEIKNPYQDGRTLLHFEGAGQKTQVYVYMTKVGEHVGGYDEWTVDITNAVNEFLKSKEAERYDGKIPVSIRCDNSRDLEMIPSNLSDFNLYGGIYRYLNLVYVPSLSMEQVHVSPTVDEKGKIGKTEIRIKFYNPGNIATGQVTVNILDPSGKKMVGFEKSVETGSGEIRFDAIDFKKPILWSPASPNLYKLEAILSSSAGKQRVDENFGFRHFEFVKQGPFMLNGERLLIRGTSRHEDHAGVAGAMTESQIRQEMLLMKEMGVNFLRLGHYQQSRIVLDLCDSLGILVWEEIPWCRGGLGGEEYKEQARRMLANLINQHYNHPSVIIWGLGNENDWPGDFPEFDKQKIRDFMKELHDTAHQLDPLRKTGIRRCDFCKDIVDIYSPSIWAGWYRGKFTEYREVSHKEMEEVDHFLHMEWGGSSHSRRHSEDPDIGLENVRTGQGADERAGDASLIGGEPRVSRDGDWSETYICNLFDWTLKEQEEMDWLTGTAFWIFKDFSTPVRPENPIPYVNQKGVLERDFTKKESFYVFQSYWTDNPMIHIYGHTWPVRWGDENEEKLLKVYSNCDKVELFLNGKSLGTKKRDSKNFPAAGLHWRTKFQIGKNTVKAIGFSGKEKIEDSLEFVYQIEKCNEPFELVVDDVTYQEDVATVKVKALDKNGKLCVNATNAVVYSLAGGGDLIDNLGTSTGSRKVQLFNGQGLIRVRLNHSRNWINIDSEGLKSVFKELYSYPESQ